MDVMQIKIHFDNSNYNIDGDESAIIEAYDKLESHLSTVMNGSGYVVSFGGTSYNVDSAKLENATNDFISHIGTITGNGKKVTVNGVQYNVDSTKLSESVDELHAVLGGLGGLHSDGGGHGLPEKSEYGFYYNVLYTCTNSEMAMAYIFCEDGRFYPFECVYNPSEFNWNNSYSYTYNETTNTFVVNEAGFFNGTFSDDGLSLTSMGLVFTADTTTTTVPHGVYYGDTYISQNEDTVVFNKDGSIIVTNDNIPTTFIENQWNCEGNGFIEGRYGFYFSIDGETVYIGWYEDGSVAVYNRIK